MTIGYEKNKERIYQWRKSNPDKYNEYMRTLMKAKYVSTLPYKWETESRRLRNIKI